jgi:hypothetical protein
MMTRKQFLRGALGVSAATLGLGMLHACGDDTTPSPNPTPTPNPPDASGGGGGGGGPNCLANGTDATVATNHGHVLVVTKEDVAAGVVKSYDIHGTADHTHTVVVTAAMFGQLAANNAIMTTSTLSDSPTFGTHSHSIMVACA